MLKAGHILVVVVTILAIVFVFSRPPIAQDIQYHLFADKRTFFSIPNSLNVLSNVAFLLVGVFGLFRLLNSSRISVTEGLKTAFFIFFTAVFFVAIGSGYYHLSPDTSSLFWDRLPMAVAFMALFSIVIGESISTKYSKCILSFLLVLGIFSVFYWYVTEMNGAGDLRLYILVQFLPMLLIPILLVLYGKKSTNITGYWLLLLCYVIAKVCEYFDEEIFLMVSVVSGHTLKHVAAATGVLFLILTYRRKI